MTFCLKANFLAFTSSPNKYAYAASFGVDNWEFSQKETELCKCYAKKFRNISVREQSGVTLCREKFGVAACHVLDPTMLLTANDYAPLLYSHSICDDPYAFTYILDSTPKKCALVSSILKIHNLSEVNAAHDIQGFCLRNVSQWKSGFEP